jgi:hypothetical protein
MDAKLREAQGDLLKARRFSLASTPNVDMVKIMTDYLARLSPKVGKLW